MDISAEIDARARHERVARDIIVRDLMQGRLLSAIFATSAKRELALKGGLAMKAAHGSPRYTKDVDLQTSPEISMSRIRSIIEISIKKSLEVGILENIVISDPKQTETVQRWKINGDIVGGGSRVSMTVEISRRGLPDESLISSIAYAPDEEMGSKAVYIESYSPLAIAAGKVDALLNPNRVAVRDVFDIYRLAIDMRIDPPTHLLKTMGRDVLAQGLVELWPKLEMMTWELAKDELLPNLPLDVADRIDEIEWDNMRMRTELVVKDWLQLAIDEIDEENSVRP